MITKLWNLNTVDLCELARASVLMSSFPEERKRAWIGDNCDRFGCDGNEPSKTNLPQIRVAYRSQTLLEELDIHINAN